MREHDEPDLAQVIELGTERFRVDRASVHDVPALVALLADYPIGRARETVDLDAYVAAFRAIDDDPNQFLAAVRDRDGVVVGTMQLTLIPGLSRGAKHPDPDRGGSGCGDSPGRWPRGRDVRVGA